MRNIFVIFVLFVFSCSHRKNIQENTLTPVSQLSSISNEIYLFSIKIESFSNPSQEKVSLLFQAIQKRCHFDSALQKEFMGYPQYIYLDDSINCVWNQNKEIIEYEKFDSTKNIQFKSYWYLGYPTLIEKRVSENHSILLNWKWVQNNRITKPTLQRISITYFKENKNIEYLFNQFSGSIVSKEEWYENKGKKLLDSWQFKYSITGEAECSFFEKGVTKNTNRECSLWNSVLDNGTFFTIE